MFARVIIENKSLNHCIMTPLCMTIKLLPNTMLHLLQEERIRDAGTLHDALKPGYPLNSSIILGVFCVDYAPNLAKLP